MCRGLTSYPRPELAVKGCGLSSANFQFCKQRNSLFYHSYQRCPWPCLALRDVLQIASVSTGSVDISATHDTVIGNVFNNVPANLADRSSLFLVTLLSHNACGITKSRYGKHSFMAKKIAVCTNAHAKIWARSYSHRKLVALKASPKRSWKCSDYLFLFYCK